MPTSTNKSNHKHYKISVNAVGLEKFDKLIDKFARRIHIKYSGNDHDKYRVFETIHFTAHRGITHTALIIKRGQEPKVEDVRMITTLKQLHDVYHEIDMLYENDEEYKLTK